MVGTVKPLECAQRDGEREIVRTHVTLLRERSLRDRLLAFERSNWSSAS
ncbi:hypothetical protein J2751_002919 [Halorubrum alkaliphilum]|uniref:Uncharacterized protein n=1 Tax=Halorubrum alkaliphilum TaxID=261290 RepID=A0A8T4GI98_9EURY|nr:hypothetical protein [Halorubrum alkaliphilum]